MAVIICEEIHENRRSSRDDKDVRTHTRCWRTTTDVAAIDGVGASDHPSLPLIYIDVHPSDPFAYASGYDVVPYMQDKSHTMWIVTITYSTGQLDEGNTGATPEDINNNNQNSPTSPSQNSNQKEPKDRPVKIEFLSKQHEKVWMIDLNDEPIVNSAGCPFDNVHTSIQRDVISIKGFSNIDYWDWFAWRREYINHFNESYFLDYEPATLLCTKYNVQPHFEKGDYHVEFDIELQYDPLKWNPQKYLDAGMLVKDVTGKPLKQATDSSGQSLSYPIPLDGSGHARTEADTVYHYREFRFFDPANFDELILT